MKIHLFNDSENLKIYRQQMVACTGHRFVKNEEFSNLQEGDIEYNIRRMLRDAIDVAHRRYGKNIFISGGATGTDQWFALEVLKLKELVDDVMLIIAKPFPSQDIRWPLAIREKFHWLCSQADLIVDVNPDPYAAWKMHARNAWMVDHSSMLIAMHCDGVDVGGTAACLSYAHKKRAFIYEIDPANQGSIRLYNEPE